MAKRYDDHHKVIREESERTERAKHVNARPYKRPKYKMKFYEEDV